MLIAMEPPEPRRFRVPWLALAAAVAVITVTTLLVWPTKVDGSLDAVVRALHAEFGVGPWSEWIQLARFLANVALFVPLALIVGLATRRWWIGLLVGIATSAASEFVQRSLPGRVASVEDVVANAFGSAIGALLVLVVLRSPRGRHHADREVAQELNSHS
jgi:VanZ family protein